jgi:polysaccharide export outer membrane protein
MPDSIPPMRTWRRLLGITMLAAPLLVACGTPTAGVAPPDDGASIQGASGQADYRLGSGDRLRITVFGQPGMTGDYQIDGRGNFAFPLIGTIQANGQSPAQVAAVITKRLQPDYLKDPNVSIEVLNYRPFYIVGEVKTPGSYPYVSGMSVINAVALAGGYTYRARDDAFYITRARHDGHKQELQATPETTVQPGDVITVRERYF